ncbi:glycosyltransferase family 1 protein [Candidatus Microgenomates bacterium]|nr:MAG: glycosyltransferase family 1 protein [Candidatus Microgenomates bacterium]
MKILIHQPRLSYYLGGGETVPLKQAEMLRQLGHQVEILTSKPPKYSSVFEEFRSNNPSIAIYELELVGEQRKIYDEKPGKDWSRWDREAIFFGQKAFDFYAKQNTNYDLVITHLLSDSLFIPKKFTNVLHLHGVPSEWRSMDEILLTRPDKFVAVSDSVKDGWINLYPELENKDIDVCYNGIDTSQFANEAAPRDIDLLYVGRLLTHKGIYQIVDALAILQSQGVVSNRLVMIGSGPESENLQNKIVELNLEKMIELKEGVSNEELISFYNRAKIFLCPSYAKEGVLTTMLEAASCGAAIITADACGMPEFAHDKENALLAKPQDSKSLADNIAELLKSEVLRKRLVTNAKVELNKNWDSKMTIAKLAKLYESYTK